MTKFDADNAEDGMSEQYWNEYHPTSTSAAFLHKLHWALMNVHRYDGNNLCGEGVRVTFVFREVLNAKGVSVTDIELPRCALMGTWMTVDGAIYPGTGTALLFLPFTCTYFPSKYPGFVPFSNRETRRVLRKPVDGMQTSFLPFVFSGL